MDWIKVTTMDELKQAKAIRHQVFVLEQGVSEELEHDQYDTLSDQCVHILLRDDDTFVGTGRIRIVSEEVGKLERICVLEEARGKGAGAIIMQGLEALAKQQGLQTVKLGAQVQAQGFYEKLGYKQISEPFEDAGIMHVMMSKTL